MIRSIVVLALCAATGCAQEGGAVNVVVDESVTAELRAVGARRVFFGHHSVGRDILDGLAAISAAARVPVAIGEGPIGANGKPLDKVRDFEREVLARDVDIALMKFCYVDFTPSTDVAELLSAYRAAVARIRAAKPALVLVHVTPPLVERPTDVKSRLKRALGRTVWEDDANVKRAAYAEGLRAAFPGEPLFDLARVESTAPDGTTAQSVVEGRAVPALWPGYSRDGGHLNVDGQRVAARALVHALAAAR